MNVIPNRPKPQMPRVLGPKSLQLRDTCGNCKFWIVRGDDGNPGGPITRCSANPPTLFTVPVPQVQQVEVEDPTQSTGKRTETRVVGMQTQITSDYPPAPPWWSCGRFTAKLVL